VTFVVLVLPAVAAVALGLATGIVQRRLNPRTATVLLTISASVAAVAAFGAFILLAFGFLTQYAPWARWCAPITGDHRVPEWAGLPAVAALVAALASFWRSHRTWARSTRRGAPPDSGIEILATPKPIAYAVPGRPGHVVVSAGMLRRLAADERRVLLAHERSHLEGSHHRYLRVVHLASSAVPVLLPMRLQIRYATERWADEDAATEVGDRRLVARAIARAALAQADHGRPAMLGLADHGVQARVDALLAEPVNRSRVVEALAASCGALVIATVTSTVQVHHLLAFVTHICPRW